MAPPLLYREEYCDLVEEKMGEGFSLAACAGIIGVSRETLTKWTQNHPAFREAVDRGKSRRLLHWERAALSVAAYGGQGSRSTMIAFGLKNMGGDEWADVQKNEHSGPGGGPIQTQTEITSARELLSRKLDRLAPSEPASGDAGEPE